MHSGPYTKLIDRTPQETGLSHDLPWLQLLPADLGSGIVVNKSGSFTAAFEVDLVAWECASDDELEQRSTAFASVLRTLAEGCELQIEVNRRRVTDLRAPRCSTLNPAIRGIEQARRRFLAERLTQGALENRVLLYLTWNAERKEAGKLGFIGSILWPRLVIKSFRHREHQMALRDFRGILQDLQSSLRAAGLQARPLANEELAEALRASTNPGLSMPTSPIRPWQYVSERVALSDVVVGVRHLQIGTRYVRVLSHKSYPDVVSPYCLRAMARLPFEYRLVLAVQISNQTAELEQQQSRHKWSFSWTQRGAHGAPVAQDKGAAAKAHAHDKVLDALYQGQRLVPVGFNMVLWADGEEQLGRMTREAQSTWTQAMKGSELLAEGVPGYEVFRSTLPGNFAASGRKRRYLSPKAADMCVGLFAGQASRGNCGRLTFFDREGGLVPFSLFDSSDKDLLARNCLIFAQMGGGKSMLLGNILLGELSHDAMVRIIDVGGSTALVSELAGGVTMRFSLAAHEKTDHINPCDVPELDDDAMAFLLGFLTSIVTKEKDDGLDQADEGRLAELLRRLYSEKSHPILSDIEEALARHRDRSMREIGAKLMIATRGPYARILNRQASRRLDTTDVVYFDFQDCANDDRLTRILMACVTQDVLNMAHRVGPGRPKVLAVDEAWRLTKTRAGARLMDIGGRTARKLRMSFLTVSQSLGDFNTPELRDSIVNNAELQFILRCTREDFTEMGRIFKLIDAELGRIRSLQTRKGEYAEMFAIRPTRRQVLRLMVPPEHYWILTSDPADRVERQAAFDRFPSRWEAIRWLAKTYPKGVEAARASEDKGAAEEPVVEDAAEKEAA